MISEEKWRKVLGWREFRRVIDSRTIRMLKGLKLMKDFRFSGGTHVELAAAGLQSFMI